MEKGQPLQQMVLTKLALTMEKNENRSFLISLYKAHVQVDQKSPHKTRYNESIRIEIEENLRFHRYKGTFLDQKTNGLCSKIKNR